MDPVDSIAKGEPAAAHEDGDCEPLRLTETFTACSHLYAGILNCLREEKTLEQATFISLERAYSYLLLWADGYGVADGSIEACLDKSKRAREATFQILISISRTLIRKLLPVLNIETQAGSSAEASKLTQATNRLRSRLVRVRLDDDSSESDSESDGDSIDEVEYLSEIAEDLTTDTQCLLDLGVRFDEPALGAGTTLNVNQEAALVRPPPPSAALEDPSLNLLREPGVPASTPMSSRDQTADQREWHVKGKDKDSAKLEDLRQAHLRDDKKRIEGTNSGLLRESEKRILDHGFKRWQKKYQNQIRGEVMPRAVDAFHYHVHSHAMSSRPQRTEALTRSFSQSLDPNEPYSNEVKDEVKEGVWGYLFPLNTAYGGKCLVLKTRGAPPMSDTVEDTVPKKKGKKSLQNDLKLDQTQVTEDTSGGYLIGRHQECDIVVPDPSVSNRHCLIFTTKKKYHDTIAIVEDLSSNGTFLNEAIIGRNQSKELTEGDEIAVLDKARFIFKYPKSRQPSAFLQQYTLLEQLGKGHFADVFLCVEKASGQKFAVKIFTKTPKLEEYSKTKQLQQEISVLMGVSHPNLLCLKDTFDERRTIFIVLELAKGDLFNHIVKNQKLKEDETRILFTQLFQGVKYLHDREMIHRDIKPENIVMVDDDLHVKLADFGLAKIFDQERGDPPSYIAPEILAETKQRKYTKAVDIWSLGVVMYICLCGFPPFSDELYSKDFPFTLSQQIRQGKFDYPSPYWDSISDQALDLIDSMLVVDPEKRFDIDQCLAHPWMTASTASAKDSTGSVVSGLTGLGASRGVVRERTLLADINSVEVTEVVDVGVGKENPHTAPQLPPVQQQKYGGTRALSEADQENPANNEPPSPTSISPESTPGPSNCRNRRAGSAQE